MIRLLIVDDSNFMRNIIKLEIEKKSKDIEIIGLAKNGLEAIELNNKLNPDCITMDINMPKLDGASATKEIMKTNPTPIIMLSANKKDADITLEALYNGAIDFVRKPAGQEVTTDLSYIIDELISKIKIASKSKLKKLVTVNKKISINKTSPMVNNKNFAKKIVAIGISTGGPRLLRKLIPLFSSDFPAAILISQHIPLKYSKQLAKDLNSVSKLNVLEAENNMNINKSTVYICPGDKHISVANKKIKLLDPKEEDIWVPSTNVLFESVANNYYNNFCAIILTGLGDDGSKSLPIVKKNKGVIIAQDENSSTIYGMPFAAYKTGLVDHVLSPSIIPAKLKQILL